VISFADAPTGNRRNRSVPAKPPKVPSLDRSLCVPDPNYARRFTPAGLLSRVPQVTARRARGLHREDIGEMVRRHGHKMEIVMSRKTLAAALTPHWSPVPPLPSRPPHQPPMAPTSLPSLA
jgi:hypothetical protein